MDTNSSSYEAAVADVKHALTQTERALALLGELPEDLHVDFDVEEWTEKLALRGAEPKVPSIPSSPWLLRG